MAIELGQKAPAFNLKGTDGQSHQISDYLGRNVVLYFYPKDDTPGCTTEACDFRDNLGRATELGAVVLGVSPDSIASHEAFIAKHSLNFVLLSDPEKTVHEAYDAWGEKTLYGKKMTGVIRSTFVINAEGTIVAKWRNLRVKGHVDRVLSELAKHT